MTTDERIEKALTLRKQGYNCAQTVLMAFSDKTGLDDGKAAIVSAALGAGASCGELCGVANALAIAEGLILADSSPNGKKKAMPLAKGMISRFRDDAGGCLACRDLKGKCGKTCEELIASGITILAENS